MAKTYIICADGACSGNPGPGGFAWEIWDESVEDGNELRGGAGSHTNTTNNIMELSAARDALEAFVDGMNMDPGEIKMRLDSQYVLKGIFEWMPGWKARGWKTGAGKPVANREIWEVVDGFVHELIDRGFTLTPNWVKGHAGDMGNERVDTKAVEMRDLAKDEANGNIREDESPDISQGICLSDIAFEETIEAPAPAPNCDTPSAQSISPQQVAMMRNLLDLYGSGDYSVKDVITQIRKNSIALGC